MEIYLIRHGFTPANNSNYNSQRGMRKIAEDRYMPLDREYGVRQALELGKFLNKIEGRTLIMVSPYQRTLETLNLALKNMNGSYEIMVCESLHEIDAGVHYARNKEEILEKYPEAIEYYENYAKDSFKTKYLKGESEYDVFKRVKGVADKIKTINEYENLFIFAHGTVNKWLYYHLNNELIDFKQKNCEVIKANGTDRGQRLFLPKPFAPIGYKIDVQKIKKLSTKKG